MFGRMGEKREGVRREQMLSVAMALCVAVVLVTLGALYLFFAMSSGLVKTMGDYETTRVVPGTYSNTIECNGAIEPIHVVDVHAPVKGVVTAVRVADGDYVRQGRVLFEMANAEGEAVAVEAEMSGTVANLNVQAGMTSDQIDERGSALQIADMNVLVGTVRIPEYVASHIEKGQWVRVFASDGTRVGYDGMVTGFARSDDQELTGSGQPLYDMFIMLNGGDDLRVGTPILVLIDIDDYGKVYYVPKSAVREQGDAAYVEIVHASGLVEQHQVELLGTTEDGKRIIKGSALTSETILRADFEG